MDHDAKPKSRSAAASELLQTEHVDRPQLTHVLLFSRDLAAQAEGNVTIQRMPDPLPSRDQVGRVIPTEVQRMSGWTREVLRRVPVVDRDTAREYVDGIVKQSPQGEPHGAVNAGAAAVDALAGAGVRSYPGNAFVVGGRAPYKAWVQRGGKARFRCCAVSTAAGKVMRAAPSR
ncbi:hypothetical protein ACFCXA_03425 [Streptomyces virginiae]|uniref:hypothetical protein n=1 Tax=Streptomyces virginiae TaxID=1961 RepID=UPI0035E31977